MYSFAFYAGEVSAHVKHLCDRSNLEMHTDYHLENEAPHDKVTLGKFKKLRPFFVKTLKAREVCLAMQDIHVRHLVEDLQSNMRRWIEEAQRNKQECECDGALGCIHNIAKYSGPLGKSMLCPRDETSGWHHRRCAEGKCAKCGWDKKLTRCTLMFNDNEDANWRLYEQTPDPRASSKKLATAEKYKDKTRLTEVTPYPHPTPIRLMV